jgi:WD40 repeat protein
VASAIANLASPFACTAQLAKQQKPLVAKEVFKAEFKSLVLCVALSRDGRWLARGDEEGKIVVWDAKTNKEKLRFQTDAMVGTLAFNADSRRFAANAGGYLRCWEVETGQEVFSIKRSIVFSTMVLHPNGKEFVLGCRDGSIEFRDAETGKLSRSVRPHRKDIRQIALSPDGKLIASACMDKTVKVCDAQTGDELHAFKHPKETAESVSFSPDGKWLATGGFDPNVFIWELKTGKLAKTIAGGGLKVALTGCV